MVLFGKYRRYQITAVNTYGTSPWILAAFQIRNNKTIPWVHGWIVFSWEDIQNAVWPAYPAWSCQLQLFEGFTRWPVLAEMCMAHFSSDARSSMTPYWQQQWDFADERPQNSERKRNKEAKKKCEVTWTHSSFADPWIGKMVTEATPRAETKNTHSSKNGMRAARSLLFDVLCADL